MSMSIVRMYVSYVSVLVHQNHAIRAILNQKELSYSLSRFLIKPSVLVFATSVIYPSNLRST